MGSSENIQQHLAAIVEGSDDAIITKGLDSVIRSWNPGAERLFGYTAEEAIGQSITILFPRDRMDEEADFMARLRRGERIAHFETVRRRKNGTMVPISLSVSPMRDSEGNVIGASKIARDITRQRHAEERQRILLSEMRHRVGNSFAVAGGLLAIAARQAKSVEELYRDVRERLNALASVHSKAFSDLTDTNSEGINLLELVGSILEPFAGGIPFRLDLPEIHVCPAAITPLSLVVYELTTNAVKYGGLSDKGAGISIYAEQHNDRLIIRWKETCTSAAASDEASRVGFGTRLSQSIVASDLGGTLYQDLSPEGMTSIIDLDLVSVEGGFASEPTNGDDPSPVSSTILR